MFSRAFSSQVQPVEIARKLAKEMDGNRTASVSRVYVPNQYTVFLSTEDHERLEGYERSLEQESPGTCSSTRGGATTLLTRPEVSLETDERLRLGEFGIQTRLVKPPARQGEQPEQGEQGQTMVYSAPKEPTKPKRSRQPGARLVETRAIVSFDDRRYVQRDRSRSSAGRANPTVCFATPTSLAATPSSAAARRGIGRWSTWAPPTA